MRKLIAFLLSITLFSCSNKQQVDLIVHHAVVYTVDSTFSNAESFAVKDGKFIAVGTNKEILDIYNAKEIIDAQGQAVYPGLIDSHCHFYGYGKGLQELDLIGTKSFEEVINRVISYKLKVTNADGWIIGRGWDQNDWAIKEFPTNKILDSIFPNTPVFLERVDGHAALVNSEALRKANITVDRKILGGIIEIKNKKLTGILIDNAVQLITKAFPKPSKENIKTSLLSAQANCFSVGLTTVDDAGLEKNIIDNIDELQKSNELKMRIYAMLTDNQENFDYYLKRGRYKTDRLNVRSFKFYADGALGSRGACLIKPYSDKPNQSGFLLNTPEYFQRNAKILFSKGWQMNTHCIGDSAVKLMTYIYFRSSLDSTKYHVMDKRWRIEHFQVTAKEDILFLAFMNSTPYEDYNIIPSVQPTHATSDMYWAKDRLGPERIKCAYAYNELLNATGIIALGTDFPVESINPFYTFYAAVARQDLKGFPEGGFQMKNALSRENTLRGMTIWGAYANFEEHEKGIIEVGKFADFIITDRDVMKVDIKKVPTTTVICTFVGGEKVYDLKDKIKNLKFQF